MSGATSRRKGARAEVDYVHYANNNGLPHLQKAPLGNKSGDMLGSPGLVHEVKNSKTTELAAWVDQMLAEMDEANADMGAVIHKRKGKTDVGEWYATLPVHLYYKLLQQAGWAVTPDSNNEVKEVA